MTNAEIKQVLISKAVTHLYHVNTVATACTFLENGGLFSRGAIEERGLFQTPQQSDDKDKEIDVFYDIFFDSVDIHERAKRINDYGPVVFVYSINLLDALPEDCIRVTKDNPIYWNTSMGEVDKYFLTLEELQSNYQRGKFNQHLTLRNQRDRLPFEYLERIIIDDPGIDFNGNVKNAMKYLEKQIDNLGGRVLLEVRQCPQDCKCREQYKSYNSGYLYYRFNIGEGRV